MKLRVSPLTLLIFGLLFMVRVSPTSAATLSETEKETLFQQANQHFREANSYQQSDPAAARKLYTKAVMRFERLISEGEIENGMLYYNTGNAYFKMGDLGKAIVNYLHAIKYRPNDPNLLHNLEYARSRKKDKIEERIRTKVLKTVLFWHYDFSAQTRSVLFAVCFILLWISASLRIISPRLAPRLLLFCLGFAALLFFGSLSVERLTETGNKRGVITAREVVARKGDGQSYEPAFKDSLHAGTEFSLIEERGTWFHIELSDSRHSWIPNHAAELIY